MRHNKKFNHLGRTKAHRDAMLSNMATSLILHKRIFTTLAKAKALRVYVEPLINRAKEDTTASRRVVFRYLQSKEAVTELFKEISVKIADRPGGYTRILKPMHLQFIEPCKRYADLIIPEGGNNQVAIDILTMYIKKHL